MTVDALCCCLSSDSLPHAESLLTHSLPPNHIPFACAGFLPDVRRVINLLPDNKQNLLFSATMPDAIVSLSSKLLDDPITVYATPDQTTVDRVTQEVGGRVGGVVWGVWIWPLVWHAVIGNGCVQPVHSHTLFGDF